MFHQTVWTSDTFFFDDRFTSIDFLSRSSIGRERFFSFFPTSLLLSSDSFSFRCSLNSAIKPGQSKFSSGSQVLSLSAYPFHFKRYSTLPFLNLQLSVNKLLIFYHPCKVEFKSKRKNVNLLSTTFSTEYSSSWLSFGGVMGAGSSNTFANDFPFIRPMVHNLKELFSFQWFLLLKSEDKS